jgi:hypothetical protein
MADKSEGAAFELVSVPGTKQDGTNTDSDNYRHGLWCRWQRGRPRKIGGYGAINTLVAGPVRGVHVDSRSGYAKAHLFSANAIEQLTFDRNGAGAGLLDRTPAGFASNALYTWQADSLFDSGGGGTPQLVCTATPDLLAIDSDVAGPVYSGNITASAALVAVADGGGAITVSGGCCVLQPFLVVYGSNGLIRNSNANNIVGAGGWAGTNANTANVAGTKVVKGLPLRGGGNAPAGLFWALDALIRMSFVGGTKLWQYDTVSQKTTILAKNSPIEFDGIYYWIGVDRFFFYNGVVQELPNDKNLNWFFDNLNQAHSNKIWATAVPRYGEIWWFFPFGESTECNQAIIYNVREKIWYETAHTRSAGFSASVFPRPVWAGIEGSQMTVRLTYTAVVGAFSIGDAITGVTSNATGTVVSVGTGKLNVNPTTGVFLNGETIQTAGAAVTGTLTAVPLTQQLDTVWQHEHGVDKVVGSNALALESYFETRGFSMIAGGPVAGGEAGANLNVRLTRLEPDFILSGSLELTVIGRPFSQSPDTESELFTIMPDTEFVSLREQRRYMSLQFRSNEVGGDYQMGRNLMLAEPGDERA